MNKPINVVVRDAENIVFDGEVDRISSFNEVGRFDIYPKHANFISIIRQELKIEQAVLKVKKDDVGIFLGIDTLVVDEENLVKKEDAKSAQK